MSQNNVEPIPLTNTALRQEMADNKDFLLLDVRESFELQRTGAIPGSVHIPMGEIPHRLSDIDPRKYVIVYCAGGVRSFDVAMFLLQNGYSRVGNLENGINGWDGERVRV